jgi:hypothetical protein
MRGDGRAYRIGGAVVLGLLSLWLALACLAQMQSRATTAAQPWVALAWDSANPSAMTRLAEFYVESGASPENSKAAVELARAALVKAPFNGVALRILGVEAQRAKDLAGARRLMAASDALTQRDSVAQLWLLARALERKDYALGLRKAESVLRRDPGAARMVYELLGRRLGDPAAVASISKRLARRPEWRGDFLKTVAAKADVDQVRALYISLERRGSPPSIDEAVALVDRLISAGRYGEAYRLWRGRAGGAANATPGLIYAADFRPRPGAPPFNWRLAEEGAAFAVLADGPDGTPALHVQVQTGAATVLADQLLLAPPARYRLDGAVWLADDLAARSVNWRVECVGDAGLLVEQQFDKTAPGGWRPFSVEFDVPATGCPAQRLAFRAIAQDRFAAIEAWSGGLKLTKIAAPAPVAQTAAGPTGPTP